VHRDVVEPFRALRQAAQAAGFDLRILSGFRSFTDQLSIWNRKARGERAVLDSRAVPLDITRLRPAELVYAILRWSALPGASRHHWGTEIDVIDRAALAPGYRPQLLPVEYQPGGPFAALNDWLDAHIREFGFFRPYRTDRGGVRPEPWHLSYAPVSVAAVRAVTPEVLSAALEAEDVLGREVVRSRLVEIHERYVSNVDAP